MNHIRMICEHQKKSIRLILVRFECERDWLECVFRHPADWQKCRDCCVRGICPASSYPVPSDSLHPDWGYVPVCRSSRHCVSRDSRSLGGHKSDRKLLQAGGYPALWNWKCESFPGDRWRWLWYPDHARHDEDRESVCGENWHWTMTKPVCSRCPEIENNYSQW